VLAEVPLAGPGPVLAPQAVPLLPEQVRASAPGVALLLAPALEQALVSASPQVRLVVPRSPSRQASWQVSAVPETRLDLAPPWPLALRPERRSSPEAHCRLPEVVEARPGIPSSLHSRSLEGQHRASTTSTPRWPEA